MCVPDAVNMQSFLQILLCTILFFIFLKTLFNLFYFIYSNKWKQNQKWSGKKDDLCEGLI